MGISTNKSINTALKRDWCDWHRCHLMIYYLRLLCEPRLFVMVQGQLNVWYSPGNGLQCHVCVLVSLLYDGRLWLDSRLGWLYTYPGPVDDGTCRTHRDLADRNESFRSL